MLILDFKSLETVLRMPSEQLLFLKNSERISNLTNTSKRNSEVYYRNDSDRFSNFSKDLGSEDPFFDTTMRKRGTRLRDGVRNLDPFSENYQNKFQLKPQMSFDINKQFNLVNKKNQKIKESSGSLHQVFRDSEMSSKINKNKKRFFQLATRFKGVCLARCSPNMKSLVTEVLCQEMSKIVLAIGDGGNDVGMIQIANVGVGIMGKEGNQAALAADFNINQFRYLSFLLYGKTRF